MTTTFLLLLVFLGIIVLVIWGVTHKSRAEHVEQNVIDEAKTLERKGADWIGDAQIKSEGYANYVEQPLKIEEDTLEKRFYVIPEFLENEFEKYIGIPIKEFYQKEDAEFKALWDKWIEHTSITVNTRGESVETTVETKL